MIVARIITNGSETTEEMVVAMVIVFSAPLVVRPSRDLNIQKKLLLTCSANNAPEAIAKPIAIGLTATAPMIGAMMPAAAIAATDTEPMAKCSTAATNHASKMMTMAGMFSFAVKRSS